MKSGRPVSNLLALFITIGAAGGFFLLLMMIPSPRPPATSLSPALQKTGPLPESARTLFVTRCAQCHALPDLTHRSRADWRILVLKMNRYMRQTGRLSLADDQVEPLIAYILEHRK